MRQWELKRKDMAIPSFGASQNDESQDDEEYVQQLIEKSKPKDYRRYYGVKIPIGEIRRLLKYRGVNDELESVAYMRTHGRDGYMPTFAASFNTGIDNFL